MEVSFLCRVCSKPCTRSRQSRTQFCSDQCRVLQNLNATKKWRDANPKRNAESSRQWDRNNKDRVRLNHYRSRYGIEVEDLEVMIIAQAYKCPICLRQLTFNGTKGRNLPVVDHCHTSKKVRGLLCTPCNLALGYLKDNADSATRMVSYIKENCD